MHPNKQCLYSLILGCLLLHANAFAQKTVIDYELSSVTMFEVDSSSGTQTAIQNLNAYLYDIGPEPTFVFEVVIDQKAGATWQASGVELIVEQYILLKASKNSAYKDLDKQYQDVAASPAWSYHGPVQLDFSRQSTEQNRVRLTSEPHQLPFLDPSNPLTFANPVDYNILGFAYRFYLKPAAIGSSDSNPADNAQHLVFLKP